MLLFFAVASFSHTYTPRIHACYHHVLIALYAYANIQLALVLVVLLRITELVRMDGLSCL